MKRPFDQKYKNELRKKLSEPGVTEDQKRQLLDLLDRLDSPEALFGAST